MIFLRVIAILLLIASPSFAGVVTTLSLIEKDSTTTSNYPLTFGHVFKPGDVADYVQVRYNGDLLTTQCDVKTTYSGDNSVRFMVISVMLPSIVADSTNIIALETVATTASTGYLDKTAILATSIEDEIRLTNLSGSGYSGSVTGDLNAQITADSSPTYWLQGSVATEILVRDGLNNSLEASWEVRFYPGTSFGPRISHSVENMNADYRGIVNYDADIQAGSPSLTSRYTNSTVQHNENSRWRKVIWIGAEPPETELHYNLAYLVSTGAVMNYRVTAPVASSVITTEYSAWASSDHDIMGNGTITKYFPETGGRPDIGILPMWSARYLNSFDNRLKEQVLGNGEMAAHCPIHYREVNPGKSAFRHPLSIDDRPTIWTTMDRVSTYGDTADRLPPAIGLYGSTYTGWTVDRAHQGSFAYLPYLITGERYFLDEMYYWAAWDLSACDYNASYGRNYSQGIIKDQTRGEAWALRNIADAAAFAADSDSLLKNYFTTKIGNNITYSNATRKDRYPLNYWNIDYDAPDTQGMVADVKEVGSPWQEDYVLLSLHHQLQLGFDWSSVITWYKEFNNGRFLGSGANPYDATSYRFPAQLTDDSYPDTWDEYASKYASPLSSWTAPTAATHDYKLIALAAASAANNASADWIYNTLDAANFDWDLFNDDPTWAIMATEQLHHSLGTVLLGQ